MLSEVTEAGFRVCGLPIDQADLQDPHDFLPMGDDGTWMHLLTCLHT